jgi:competence protein ComEA
MGRGWKRTVLGFFRFTESERKGIIVLVVVAFIILGSRIYIVLTPPTYDFDVTDFECEIRQFLAAQTIISKSPDTSFRKNWKEPAQRKLNLFDFDPNTLTVKSFENLGLSTFAIRNIKKYREKGGVFVEKEDLKKIYGISNEQYNELAPHIQISSANKGKNSIHKEESEMIVKRIDVNRADAVQLRTIYGIGKVLSSRIVTYRDRLGGFVATQQLSEVYGISDSLFQLISPQLVIQDSQLVKININNCTARDLIQHPYIESWDVANAIVNYRKAHQTYQQLDELHSIHLMDSALIGKLQPYLTLN